MSAAQIQDRLALPETPTQLVTSPSVSTGVNGYVGVVAPNFGQTGGAIQFYLPPGSVSGVSVTPLTY